ncbi:MAG TPA: flagellar hook-length control protein FliK [Caulobacteraceae bacterium]|nr:flagellar hook-length control protein FliK [Caulobacteraceae bacterium]
MADAAELAQVQPAAETPSPLAAMIADAATRQDSLAPLLADLAQALNTPATPPDVRNLAARILASPTPLDADVTPAALIAATQSSGLFLEARLAAAADDAGTMLQLDLKALLIQLSGELGALIEPPATKADAQRGNRARSASEQIPPPPLPGGRMTGQPAAKPSFDADAQTGRLVRTLHQEVEGALARIELAQAASIERTGETTRWLFELPIATADGTGVAQFEISRDGAGAQGAGAAPSWRARFSIEPGGTGPVQADVMLGHGRTRVLLAAQDDAARNALAAHQHELASALAADHGPDVAVRIVGGLPPTAGSPPGQLMDRRS